MSGSNGLFAAIDPNTANRRHVGLGKLPALSPEKINLLAQATRTVHNIQQMYNNCDKYYTFPKQI